MHIIHVNAADWDTIRMIKCINHRKEHYHSFQCLIYVKLAVGYLFVQKMYSYSKAQRVFF